MYSITVLSTLVNPRNAENTGQQYNLERTHCLLFQILHLSHFILTFSEQRVLKTKPHGRLILYLISISRHLGGTLRACPQHQNMMADISLLTPLFMSNKS